MRRRIGAAACLLAVAVLAACRPQPVLDEPSSGTDSAVRSDAATGSDIVSSTVHQAASGTRSSAAEHDRSDAATSTARQAASGTWPSPIEHSDTEAELTADDHAARATALLPPGLRQVVGRHLTLVTDVPPTPAVDGLVWLFDAAFEPWCRFFELSPAEHRAWHMTGYLIRDRARFDNPEMWPADLPPFENGYSIGRQLWLYDQPSEYYRRHLLLHEGVHGVMNTLLGGAGSPWYMEGVAELLSTHRWQDGNIELAIMPRNREEVPYLGRIKLVQDAVAAGRFFPLSTLLEVPPSAFRSDEAYAWVWASAVFLDRHPQYGPAFRALVEIVRAPDFTAQVRRQLTDDWTSLEAQWQVFASELEHGYDFERAAVDLAAGRPLDGDSVEVTLAADRGWQNTGLKLEAGRTYRLSAAGRYQLADRPHVWWSEPGGVSIRYYRGRPLGRLLAAVWSGDELPMDNGVADESARAAGYDNDQPTDPDRAALGATDIGAAAGRGTLVDPWSVGLVATIRPAQSGTLLLRINDSPAELSDNAGSLRAEISPLD